MSLAIRPVTRRFPSSFDLWEETNLPLAVVLQPLETSSHEDEAQDEPAQPVQQGSTGSSRTRTAQQQQPLLLTHIPKCLHCGSPHPDSRTHYAPPRKTTKDPMASPYERRPSSSSSSSWNNSHVLLCYLCGKMSSTRLDQQVMARREDGAQNVQGNEEYRRLPPQPTHTFALPLRLPPSAHAGTASSRHFVYKIPAMACPPLWFWILDGTATDRSYWHAVSDVLQTCLAQLPPFCHVSLLLACRQDRGVGVFQLDSATPHVQYYPYASSSSFSSASASTAQKPVPSHAHEDGGAHHASTTAAHAGSAAHEHDSNEAAVFLLRQRIMQSLVPADGSHVDHIQAALRSLLDVHSLVESDTLATPTSATSAADPQHHQHSHAGMPLAETLTHLSEALLTFGHAAGQKPASSSSPLLNSNVNGGDSIELFVQDDALLPYAGGKVTVLLANRPADLPHHNQTTAAAANYYNSYLASDDAASSLPSSSLYAYGGWGGRTASRGGGAGGLGGGGGGDFLPPYMASQEPTMPFYSDTGNDDDNDEEDLEKLSDFFAELGRQCADAALGVDILGLVSSLTNGMQNHDKDLGLVVLGGLSYKSGAAGPLLFDLHQTEARRNLAVEVSSRSPWLVGALSTSSSSSSSETQSSTQPNYRAQEQRVFGAELRLRLSQGFSVDDTVIEPPPSSSAAAAAHRSKEKKKKQIKKQQRFYDGFDDDNQEDDDDDEDEDSLSQPFLACLHGEKGLMGPACAVPDEDTLWRMGTCDPYTAFTIDLDMAGSSGGKKKKAATTIPQDVMVDGWGRVPLKAVMQTCFAYTTIIKGNDTDGDDEYYTVRRMKISSCPVPLAHDAETIYNAVDPEATAVILFHKLTMAFFQEGLLATRTIATDWLQSLLLCVYRSAENQAEIEQEMKESGIEQSSPSAAAAASATTFLPSERLLHQEGGTLSEQDVLLAQGHARLKAFPLMIYLLLQCDAFRRHQELSAATALSSNMDLRYAALYQMAHMTPDVLVRCIAPMLQLWAAAAAIDKKKKGRDQEYGDEPILDMIDLRASAIDGAIKEYSNNPQSSPLILFMDTPYQMLLLNANAVISTQEEENYSGGATRRQKSRTPPASPVVGPALAKAVQDAANRYRTRPPMIRALDITNDSSSSMANESATTRAVQHIWDACLEDVASEGDTYAQWKCKMAEQVHEELQEDEDFEDGHV